mgnify:CR=1 FL=1|jgi:hypothetical protein|tara:strand:- start:710 stop:979 length:270 start_codon:yes stop_codon:yes gene_type:complete
MTNNEHEEWMEDVVNGKPKEAEHWQLNYIESILPYTSLPSSDKENILLNINELSEIEAEEILKYLKENEIKRDPKDQYEQMRKNGVFDS